VAACLVVMPLEPVSRQALASVYCLTLLAPGTAGVEGQASQAIRPTAISAVAAAASQPTPREV
jgi:hypothetical protein